MSGDHRNCNMKVTFWSSPFVWAQSILKCSAVNEIKCVFIHPQHVSLRMTENTRQRHNPGQHVQHFQCHVNSKSHLKRWKAFWSYMFLIPTEHRLSWFPSIYLHETQDFTLKYSSTNFSDIFSSYSSHSFVWLPKVNRCTSQFICRHKISSHTLVISFSGSH